MTKNTFEKYGVYEYNGYTANIEFDTETSIFYGSVSNILDVIEFIATSSDDISIEFQRTIEDYYEKNGRYPEKY